MSEGEGKGKDKHVKREKIGGVRRGGKGERQACEAREDRRRPKGRERGKTSA